MTELTHGIFTVASKFYKSNKGSLLRTLIYTIGHFVIAITVLMLVADVPFAVALTDAIVEPIANSIWYFVLDKIWITRVTKKSKAKPKKKKKKERYGKWQGNI
jgi:uncharacterized membrane protein